MIHSNKTDSQFVVRYFFAYIFNLFLVFSMSSALEGLIKLSGGNIRDLQIRLRLRVRVRLLSARGLGLSCRGHCCCRRQLATKIFQ